MISINSLKISILVWFLGFSTMVEAQDNTVDPYNYFSLKKLYPVDKIDFRKEYKEYLLHYNCNLSTYDKIFDITGIIPEFDFDKYIFGEFDDEKQDGVIGRNYKRLQIHLDSMRRSKKDPYTYIVYGKTNVLGNICSFKGTMKLIALKRFLELYQHEGKTEISNMFDCLIGQYVFRESENCKSGGVFKGYFQAYVYADYDKRTFYLDTENDGADGYTNRNYVGIWQSYRTGKKQKAIWGDFRLPYTFDFSFGAGEMYINPKYENNGWISKPRKKKIRNLEQLTIYDTLIYFPPINEYEEDSTHTYYLKKAYQWWLK
jgi:hypothetical protein